MELRPYQVEVINKIEEEWKFHDSILLQMPTGTGKTNVFCEIIKRHRLKNTGSRILILTHKRELVYQTVERLKSFLIPSVGKIMAGTESKPDNQIQIATVQTLIRRKGKLDFLRNISLIVIDEAHHTPSETYLDLLSHYKSKNTLVLGVTATPRRTDGKGFAGIFGTLVQSCSIKEFIERGYLANVEHYKTACYYDVKRKLSDIPIDKLTNDFDEVKLAQLMSNEGYMSDAVESYLKYRGNYTKSIVFAVNIKHSESLVARFNRKGIKAAHLDGDTPKEMRKNILSDFNNGLISVLCNVGIVTEGFDCPDAEIVQLVRPTKSITLYLQQVGRVLRPKQDGRHALILDSACCYDEFGSVKSDRKWTLEAGDDGTEPPEPDSGKDSEPTRPPEDERIMIQVDEPEPPAGNACKLDEVWLEKLTPEIREYFTKRFAYDADLNPQKLIQNIWKLKEIDLSRMSVKSIRNLKELLIFKV
ncbi:MAG: DEAD/DEAH box helicase [Cyclobacteriaceae bacterium]|nr:DEAD/DEAH box helicase [Cyclobacteriaceae bacterium]